MSKLKKIYNKIDSVLKAHNVTYDELLAEVKSRLKTTGKREKKEKLKEVEVKEIVAEEIKAIDNSTNETELIKEIINT